MSLPDSEMKGKDQMISELKGTVDDLADAVAKREREMCSEVPSQIRGSGEVA